MMDKLDKSHPDYYKIIGAKGGKKLAERVGSEGMAARGKKGGEARKKELGKEGYAKMGRKGGKKHDPEYMRKIASKGGKNRHKSQNKDAPTGEQK